MIIQDEHIKEAEKILIGGKTFDPEERVPFIKNLDACDLLAVPGSGKTTALLAKLYCIAKHLPFKDGSGILVLSHTNAAVEEIEKHLKPFCPVLFQYPNFVGTVQSFVNTFIANQACFEKYGSYIRINDDDLINDQIVKKIGLQSKVYFYLKKLLRNNEIIIDVVKTIKYSQNNFVSNRFRSCSLSFTSASGKQLKKIYDDLKNNGEIFYYNSFELADYYLEKHFEIIEILQCRFKYVFIDEMQDLDETQIKIIDKIFYGTNISTVIQRIGDINQAIYNSAKKIKVEADWVPRNQMYLNGSNRLTREIASIVNCFTLDKQQDENDSPRFVVEGRRNLNIPIKPHIILFDNNTMKQLEEKFKELIHNFSLHKAKEAEKYGFKIIGWNARWDDAEDHDGKLRLEDIFKSYKKEAAGNKESYNSLSKYVQLFDHKKPTLEAVRKAVLNALIHVLRIEGKTHLIKIRGSQVNRYYTKAEMIEYIKSKENHCDYELFKSKVYQWSFDLAVNKNYKETYNNIKEFIENDFKTWFDLTISQNTIKFIGSHLERIIINSTNDHTRNDDENSMKIEIGTVHSAKGQTHCATMYVETAYQRPPYESEKIIKRNSNPLLAQEHCCNGKYDKQAVKMMYVGFSRPTHLLCFACLKENITHSFETYKSAGWEVVDLTQVGVQKEVMSG